MRYGGEGRTRLLLIILIVTALFLITLDLRGVAVLDGARQGTQTILSPFQKALPFNVAPSKLTRESVCEVSLLSITKPATFASSCSFTFLPSGPRTFM
jgi:hypothetical protein